MDDHRQQISSIISTTSLVAIVAIGSFILFDKPFQSERPPSNISTSLLESRLWEDPFTAVFSLREMEEQYLGEAEDEADGNFARLYKNYTRNCADFQKEYFIENQPLILGVTLPGNRFTLSGETRRRIRYAVLSAINQTHVPLNSESISILGLARPSSESFSANQTDCDSTAAINAQRYLVSFEVFKPYKPVTVGMNASSESYFNRDIIVLWLPEEELGTKILKNYTGLLRHIYPGAIIPQNSVLLGPISSNGLVDLQVERFNSNTLTSVIKEINEQIKEKILIPPYDSLRPDRLIHEASEYTQSIISRKQQLDFLKCLRGTSAETDSGAAQAPATTSEGTDTKRYKVEEARDCLNKMAYFSQDPDWPNTVISRLSRDPILDPIEDTALRADLMTLLRTLNQQSFRNALSEKVKGDLVSCLILGENSRYLSREAVSVCLEKLAIADSSLAWYDTPAALWPDASVLAMLDNVPEDLRADVSQLITRADSYLDNGLPDDKRPAMIGCFTDESAITALTRENVAPCLQALDIDDSNPVWFDTIAGDWPDARRLAELEALPESLRDDVDSLIDSAEEVLYTSLSDDQHALLITCFGEGPESAALTRASVTSCLRALDVDDSDPDWFATIADDWPDASRLAELEVLPENLRDDVVSLVNSTEAFLYAGLSKDKRLQLIGCFAEQDITALTRDSVAPCLQALAIPDSDPQWHDTVASNWPDARRLAELETLPESLRTGIASLMDSAEETLGTELPDDKRRTLLDCLVGDRETAQLTSDVAAFCLSRLDLEYSSAWMYPISDEWPTADLIAVPMALRADFFSLIQSANFYLEPDLTAANLETLISCFATNNQFSALTRENTFSCLRNLNLSAPDWYDAIAGSWPSERRLGALADVPETLRPDVAVLLDSVDNYLYTSLSDEQRVLVIGCFTQEKQITALTRDNVAPCLQALAIADSNPTWFDTIAGYWPDARRQTELANVPDALRTDVSSLIDSTDNYLDNGLSDAKRVQLIACFTEEKQITALTRANVAPCLQALAIADSNTTWFDAIASNWPDAGNLDELDNVPEELRVDVARLLDATDSYLDDGLPDDRRAPLIDCFTDGQQNTLTRANVASCLQALAIADSNATWFDAVASDWPDTSRQAELVNVPESLRADVTTLIDSADDYLDNGLPDIKRMQLIACFSDGQQITALTRAVVASCLQTLELADSNATWFDTIADNWPNISTPTELSDVPESLRPAVAGLIDAADDYLDNGLPGDKRLQLIACFSDAQQVTVLTRANVASCLEALAIADSNPTWFDTIAADWPDTGRPNELDNVPEALRADVASLLDAADSYLDTSQRDARRATVIACFTEEKGITALTRENVSSCLQSLNIDSYTWFSTVSREWPYEGLLVLPEALRSDVASLITQVESNLDNSLPDSQRERLIDCFASSQSVTALTSENVGACMQTMRIGGNSVLLESIPGNWANPRLPGIDNVLEPIRDNVINLLDVANNLLEYDLPTELNDDFVNCFNKESIANLAISSYGAISGCLQKLVSPYEPIAVNWPDGSRLAELAPLRAGLRDEVASLIDSADSYLDSGLSEDQRAQLIACFAKRREITVLTRDNVAPCLEALAIADSDMTWFNTIASNWPDAGRLAELNSVPLALHPDVTRLLESADSYLDNGLPASQRAPLIACFAKGREVTALTRANVAPCLQALDVTDSDTTWFDTIARNWPDASKLAGLDAVPEVLRADVASLLDSVNSYLYTSLTEEQHSRLIGCFSEENPVTALTRDNVAPCLQALGIDDVDTTWFDTIAGNWPDAGRLAELDNVPVGLRTDVTSLIASTNNFLGEELPDATRAALIACYSRESGATALTRQNVVSCLDQLNISRSDDMWHEKITEKFQTAATIDRALVLSPRATISRTPLFAEAGVSIDDPTSPIIRTIKSDGVLLDAIFQELTSNRGLDPASANVALVYENDGKFGRALENRLKCKPNSVNLPICFASVKSFGYLRGIDGLLAKDANTSNTGQNNANNTTIESLLDANENLEVPYGQHQYDYLRRLADEIGREKYDVIGVLGTDIFDKLLVLQALRAINPDAVFFTTDLDDYMAHASQANWTQNLLVASSFGLNGLNDKGNDCRELSGNSGNDASSVFAPPFRDNYQTSYFYSTCLALQVPELGKAGLKDAVNYQLLNHDVRLYEVGRNGLQLLPGANADTTSAEAATSITRWRRLFADLSWGLFMLPSIAVMLLSLGKLVAQRAEFRNAINSRSAHIAAAQVDRKPVTSALTFCFWTSLGAIAGMTALLIAEAKLPGGEPLIPAQGISHWPATLIRIQILTLSLCFYVYATRIWRANRKQISQLLGPANQRHPQADTGSSTTWASAGIAAWIREVERDNRDNLRARKHFRDIWTHHAKLGPSANPRYKYIVALKTLGIAAVVFATFYLLTPQPHLIRDSYFVANLLFGKPFVALVGLVAIATIVFANDVIRLNRASIGALRRYNVTGGFCNLNAFNHDNYLDNRINEVIFKLEFIAKRTRDIELCMMFPFAMVLLAIISRSTLFEGWHWSLPLIVLYCVISAYLLYCVVMLQVEATKTKKDALDFLLLQQREYSSMEQPMRAVLEEELRVATRHVTNLDKGAFAAWYKHPLLLSMALPTSGTSGLLMLQQFF